MNYVSLFLSTDQLVNGVLNVVEPLGAEIILVVLQENLVLKGAHLEAVLPTALIWTPVNGGVQQAEHKFGLDGTLCLSSIKKPLENLFKTQFFLSSFLPMWQKPTFGL